MDKPVLELENISHAFSRTSTFRDINLKLFPGEIVSILGESGEGKSTLLHCIAGFLSVKDGEIRFGENIISKKGYTLVPEKRNIGIVFQDLALFPHLTVWDNIAFSLRKNKENIVNQMLKLTGIGYLKNKYPHQISGGEQQRVALARSLACFPRLLLLDEAFSHLDPHTKESLISEFRCILKKLKVCVIHVTHDFKEAFSFADRVAIMAEGIFSQISTPWNIYHRPKNEKVLSLLGPYRLIDARVIERNPLKISSMVGTFTYEDNKIHSDSPCLVIRPENLMLGGDGDKEGVVREVKYLGSHREYTLDYQGISLPAYDHGDFRDYKLGEKTRFTIAKKPSCLFQVRKT